MAAGEQFGETWAVAQTAGPVDVRVFIPGTVARAYKLGANPVMLFNGVDPTKVVVQNLDATLSIELGVGRDLAYGQGLRIPANAALANGSVIPGAGGVVNILEAFTRASLPAVGNPGRIVHVTDSVGGLFLDTGTQWVSLDRETIDPKEFGAIGDGIADDQPALQAQLNKTGVVVLSSGPNNSYRINAADLVVPDLAYLVCLGNAELVLDGRSLQFGSKGAQLWRTGGKVRVRGTHPANKALVESYNLLGDPSAGDRQLVVTLSANALGQDLFHAHSVAGLGSGVADGKAFITTGGYQCANGILMQCGDDLGGAASVANDFINGWWLEGSGLSCTNDGIRLRGIGPVAGSVQAPVARNWFVRLDVNSFGAPAGAGRGLRVFDIGVARNEFIGNTFETGGGGAAVDIDTAAGGGQYFKHTVARAKAAQLMTARDKWIDSERDEPDDLGIYELATRYVKRKNRLDSGTGLGLRGVNVAPFVGSGVGSAGRLYVQGEADIEFALELNETVAGATYQVALYRSTIGVPANGAALGGGDVQLWASQVITSAGAGVWGHTLARRHFDLAVNPAVLTYYYIAYGVVAGGGFAQIGPNPTFLVNGGS